MAEDAGHRPVTPDIFEIAADDVTPCAGLHRLKRVGRSQLRAGDRRRVGQYAGRCGRLRGGAAKCPQPRIQEPLAAIEGIERFDRIAGVGDRVVVAVDAPRTLIAYAEPDRSLIEQAVADVVREGSVVADART